MQKISNYHGENDNKIIFLHGTINIIIDFNAFFDGYFNFFSIYFCF